MTNGITKANLERTVPRVLVNDDGMRPLADTLADALESLAESCGEAAVYAMIEVLPEGVLDILAEDFKVDWYDHNADIPTKRSLVKDSFYVHRHRGTRSAVERALSDVWPNSRLEEWFEYGGDPYHFRAVMTTEWSAEEEIRATEAINKAKNVRSVLDNIIFNSVSADGELYTAAAFVGIEIADEATNLETNEFIEEIKVEDI